jgi:hypothetical protein
VTVIVPPVELARVPEKMAPLPADAAPLAASAVNKMLPFMAAFVNKPALVIVTLAVTKPPVELVEIEAAPFEMPTVLFDSTMTSVLLYPVGEPDTVIEATCFSLSKDEVMLVLLTKPLPALLTVAVDKPPVVLVVMKAVALTSPPETVIVSLFWNPEPPETAIDTTGPVPALRNTHPACAGRSLELLAILLLISVTDTPNTPVARLVINAPGVELLKRLESTFALEPGEVFPKCALAAIETKLSPLPLPFTRAYTPIGAPVDVSIVVVLLAVTA